MSTHRNIDLICIAAIILGLILTVLFMNGERLGIQVIRDADAEDYDGTEWFTANDLNGAWDDSAATVITLKGETAKVSGGGAYAWDGDVVITGGGRYTISGALTDGSIRVDAENSSKVWIRLNGVNVSCTDDACLRVDQADKVFLTLAGGTENSFTSGAEYSQEALADKTGGVIFAHDDLTINGSGSLSITAAYKHGIDANDALVIAGGTITISAPGDAVHVNDSFRFTGASLTVEAGDDAVHCDREICIESGSILLKSCYEGLEAHTIDIAGGDITIYPSDDGLNANGGSGGFGFGGFRPGRTEQTKNDDAGEEEISVRISGGTITIINESARDADGIDSNGSVFIDGGFIRISLPGSGSNNAIDYGSERGGVCVVTGGDLIACGGSMMTEAFSASSTQCAVLYNPGSTAAAGTRFRVLDAEGRELLSFAPICSYSSVAFSCGALAVGETYTVCIGDSAAELTLEGTASEFGSGGGFGFGGFGGFGGKNDRGGFGGERPQGGAGSRGDASAGTPKAVSGRPG